MSMPDPTALLRERSLRVTRPRVAVLTALGHHPHADADRIAAVVRQDLGSVSKQTIYDVLRALCDVGLVRSIEPAGSPARFETRVGDNHHHVVCRDCGALADVTCTVGRAPCLEASDAHGFDITEAEVTYWGRCPDCAAGQPNERTTDQTIARGAEHA